MATDNTSRPGFKVGLIQMKPKPVDPEHNFNYAASQIRQAAEQGASLAVLPEYHLTGWAPDHPDFIRCAQDAHKYQKQYQDLAAELKINICPGTIVQTPPEKYGNGSASQISVENNQAVNGSNTTNDDEKPKLLNISSFISYTGELLGTYIKTNIWIPERQHLTSSIEYHQDKQKKEKHAGVAHDESKPSMNPHTIIETPLGPVGLLICWDLAFPEAFRQLVLAGAKIIIIPTFWSAFDMSEEGRAYNKDAEKLFLLNTLVARAYENTAAVIFCNAGGPAEEGYLGLSQVALPLMGMVEGSFTDATEGMRVVEVDMSTVEVAERNYKIRQDIGGETWHYGYSHATGS